MLSAARPEIGSRSHPSLGLPAVCLFVCLFVCLARWLNSWREKPSESIVAHATF
jgi:hypothetical protein